MHPDPQSYGGVAAVKKKSFDCVEMKQKIQARILDEFAGLSPQQQRERSQEMILNDPILGPLWREKAGELPPGSNAPRVARS